MRRLTGSPRAVVLLFSWCVLWHLPGASADVVYDRAGGTLKGLVVEEHRDRIVMNTEEGERPILRSQIEEIFYSEPERNYLYLGNQALDEGDISSARGFFQKALQINPRLLEVEDALHRAADLERKMHAKDKPSHPVAALDERWGLMLQAGLDRVIVAEVRAGSPAQRVGFIPGDALVAVWGSSLAFLSPEQVAEALWGPPGSTLKLTIQRQVHLPDASMSPAGLWPGMKIGMDRLGLTVLGTESPVEAAALGGLRPDDRIVAIEGRFTRYMPLAEAQRQIQKGKQKGLTLLIHRDLMMVRK